MLSRRSIRLSVALSALMLTSGAFAASPKEDMVTQWLTGLSGELGASIESSSYDPALQSVSLRNVRIGDVSKGLFELDIDELSVTDPREAPDGAFAAHSLRASGYRIKLHIDLAAWAPAASDKPSDSEHTDAAPADETASAAVATDDNLDQPLIAPTDQAPVGVDEAPEASAEASPAEDPTADVEGDAVDMPSLDAGDAPADATASDTPAPAEAMAEAPKVLDYVFEGGALTAERVVLPASAPAFVADANPFQRFLAVMNWGIAIRADWIETSDLSFTVLGDGKQVGQGAYQSLVASGLQEGRVERVGFDGVSVTYPEDSPIKSISLGNGYMNGIDRRAILEVLDPAAYKDGKGDGVRRTVYSQYGFSDFKMEFEGGFSASIDSMEVNGVYLRQTDKPLAGIIMQVMQDPSSVDKDPMAFLSDVLPSFTQLGGVNDGAMSGFKVTEGETDVFSLGSVEFADVDGNGVGRFQLHDMALDLKEPKVSGKLDLVAVHDVRFGSFMPFIALAKESEAGGTPSPETIRNAILEGSTRVGFIEAAGFSVDTPEGSVSLGGLAVTSGDFLKMLPRRADITLSNLTFPVSILPEDEVRTELTAMGYADIAVTAGLTLSWDTDKGDVRLEDMTLRARDMGSLSMDVHLGNLPLSIIDKPEAIEARLMEGTLVSANAVYGNEGIVEKGFEAQAKKLNQDGETFRKNTAGAVPLMLSFLNDKTIQDKFAGPIKEFLNDPKSVILSLKPKAPVSFAILQAFKPDDPAEGFKLVGLDLKANE